MSGSSGTRLGSARWNAHQTGNYEVVPTRGEAEDSRRFKEDNNENRVSAVRRRPETLE